MYFPAIIYNILVFESDNPSLITIQYITTKEKSGSNLDSMYSTPQSKQLNSHPQNQLATDTGNYV